MHHHGERLSQSHDHQLRQCKITLMLALQNGIKDTTKNVEVDNKSATSSLNIHIDTLRRCAATTGTKTKMR